MVTSKFASVRARPSTSPPPATRPEDRENRRARLARAKLFAEIARRTESPFDALPGSDASIALVVLWKEAAFWALAALVEETPSAEEVGAVLERVPPEVIAEGGGSAEWMPTVELALTIDTRNTPTGGLPARRRQTATLAAFARELIAHLEAPDRERDRRMLRRILGGVAVAVLCAALAASVWLRRGPNLAARATMTTSSEFTACRGASDCGNAIFHTEEEDQPWVMYDLGEELELHLVEVENRTDCCYERAVPLVVETSGDGATWSEQLRTERAFSTWSAKLRTKARYVRLRVDRRSYLHLQSVIIR